MLSTDSSSVLPPDNYSFDVKVGEQEFEFQFSIYGADKNIDVLQKLEKLIIDEVLMLSYDDNAIKALIKPRKETDHRKAINSLERQKSRLIDLYAVGGIDLDALSIKINELTERIATLKADKSQPPEITFDEAKQIFSNVKDIFSNGTIEQQRVLLSSLIKKIVLTGNDIEIHWRFS